MVQYTVIAATCEQLIPASTTVLEKAEDATKLWSAGDKVAIGSVALLVRSYMSTPSGRVTASSTSEPAWFKQGF